MTTGVKALLEGDVTPLLKALADYDSFDEDNDPHGERDFGDLDYAGAELLWKIDYYDTQLKYGSPDPANSDVTRRVLTIMLAEEYLGAYPPAPSLLRRDVRSWPKNEPASREGRVD